MQVDSTTFDADSEYVSVIEMRRMVSWENGPLKVTVITWRHLFPRNHWLCDKTDCTSGLGVLDIVYIEKMSPVRGLYDR
jgi:hypothetical protein